MNIILCHLQSITTAMNKENLQITKRPPIVAIMGHIDHGKSTLLSYIRKSNKPLNEAGGITQHISAYEVEHISKDGKKSLITFLDTPGHEAFGGIRRRGADVADIVVLVVSAEDGVKPQTLEALASIRESKKPYIVAITKVDKLEANIERTKQSLAENEIYLEGYGGDVPAVSLSSKTGQGVSDLLDMIGLVAELENISGNPERLGKGVVIESNRHLRKGISATCIIKDGHIEKGMFVGAGLASAPVRIMENYLGKPVDYMSCGNPVKIIGWDILPEVGSLFQAYKTREEVKESVGKIVSNLHQRGQKDISLQADDTLPMAYISLIVKADTGSSLEALLGEIGKVKNDRVRVNVISCGIGRISENDVQGALGSEKAIIVGFNVKIDSYAQGLAERSDIDIKLFDIIYKMSQWLKDLLLSRMPKVKMEESTGRAKILKIFSKVKDKQIVGAKVEKGSIIIGAQVKIFRRGADISQGRIRELQVQKIKNSEVSEGKEFGAMIEAKMEIAPGDYIESFIIIEK